LWRDYPIDGRSTSYASHPVFIARDRNRLEAAKFEIETEGELNREAVTVLDQGEESSL
jgi:hypothetical protein